MDVGLYRVSRVIRISVLMLLTLVGNISLIAVIASQASLRRKRVSVFLLNLAVGEFQYGGRRHLGF